MTMTALAESTTTQQQNFFYLIPGNRNIGYYRLVTRYFPQYGYSAWVWSFIGPTAHNDSTPYFSRKEALEDALANATRAITIPAARKDVCDQMRAELART